MSTRSLRAWPGQYDQMAAGGQPVGIQVRENMIKELAEEDGQPVLKPHNPAYPLIRPAGRLEIFGVMVGLVRRLPR